MKRRRTIRGFGYYEFQDDKGNQCSVQKSSSALRDCIWLGVDDLQISGFIPFGDPEPWVRLTLSDIKENYSFQDAVTNQRMHLTRHQVKKLLPILQRFVETGEI